jgi:magnesium-transporting ATPase (P-type)
MLVRAMALCNDAGPDATGRVVGDPTEVAFFEAARRAGVDRGATEAHSPRLSGAP